MTDLAFDPTTNVLYGIASVGGAHLYIIDTTTGQATLVGDSGFTATNGGGVAVSQRAPSMARRCLPILELMIS